MPQDRDSALSDFARRLEQILDLRGIDPAVVERAAADPSFLDRLISLRGDTTAVQALMATVSGSLPKWASPPTVVSMARLTAAMARWAAVGFKPVADTVLHTRVAACRRCPHLTEPGAMLQKVIAGSGKTVCGLCSCAVEKKAMLPTETCPAPDSERPGYNRWGEPHSA
jgi:hypothetical protein